MPRIVCSLAILLTLSSASVASADLNRSLSDVGLPLFVVAGAGLPLLRDGKQGTARFLRVSDAFVVDYLATEGLKRLTNVPRPEGGGQAFPSGHASAAFAVATMESAFHPREAPLWFAGASLIAYSRIPLRAHTWAEVLAGAALGYGAGRLELSSRNGLILAPFVGSRGFGLTLSARIRAR